MVQMDPVKHVICFIDGMLHEDVHMQSRVRWSDCDGDVKKILSHADGIERSKKAEEE